MGASQTSSSGTHFRLDAIQHRHASWLARGDLAIALAFFAVALIARLIFLLNSPDRDWPHSTFYEGDAILWVEWAKALDSGGVYQFDLPIHPPAVAYAIAYFHDGVKITGFVGVKMLWCAMSAAACAFTFLACAANMRRRIAVIATLLLTLSFGQYVLATSLNNETPYVMLLTMIVWLTQRTLALPTRWTILTLGIAHGIAMLLRAEHPLLLAMFLLWMLIAAPPTHHRLRVRAPSCACFRSIASIAFIALLICLPWTIHATLATRRFNTLEVKPIAFNLAPITWTTSAQDAIHALPAFARSDIYFVLNHWAQTKGRDTIDGPDVSGHLQGEFGWVPRDLPTFVPVSNQGAFSFALANHPDCGGGFSRAALAHPMRGNDPEFAFAFPPHNRVFIDGWRVGWGSIKSDPLAWMRLVGRKFERFADGVTCGFGARNLPLSREGVREPVDMFVSDSPNARWWQPLLLVLIATGIILALARRIPCALWLLLILNKLIITIAFYGYARQGASIAPAFYVFIAIAIDSMLLPIDGRVARLKRWQPAIVLALCGAMLIGDLLLSRRHEQIAIKGLSVERRGLGPNAFQAFNRIELRNTL